MKFSMPNLADSYQGISQCYEETAEVNNRLPGREREFAAC